MNVRLTALATALFACSAPVLAATSNLYVYGNISTGLPTHDVFSQVGAVDLDTPPVSTIAEYQETFVPGNTAAISTSGYNASASTTMGSNHAYTSYNGSVPRDFVIGSSNWFDQVTITGGTGTGTATITAQVNGTATVGAAGGYFSYQLGTRTTHPYTNDSSITGVIFLLPSPYQDPFSISPVAEHSIEFLPFSNPIPTSLPCGNISSVNPVDLCSGPPLYDQTLGAGIHDISLTLTGTINFTYGEAFYLIGSMGAGTGDGFTSFTVFGDPTPEPDGTGATTLDFVNSALLAGIVLPQGASFASASGAAYNVTAVPEPGEWAMLLAGLGLVVWRTRRKTA
ncbi:MAG: PEP-CTERM sorting domain-containing protein [Thiobacillus sp.]|nr:PEP-CTERM sorting domain-containing protein [Thiobacillus sp.]